MSNVEARPGSTSQNVGGVRPPENPLTRVRRAEMQPQRRFDGMAPAKAAMQKGRAKGCGGRCASHYWRRASTLSHVLLGQWDKRTLDLPARKGPSPSAARGPTITAGVSPKPSATVWEIWKRKSLRARRRRMPWRGGGSPFHTTQSLFV